MERRVLIAIFASFLVIYLWQAFFGAPPPKPAVSQVSQATETSAEPANTTGSALPAGSQGAPAATPAAPTGTPVVTGTAERDVHVDTNYVTAVFTNRGGRLKSWRLKHYPDEHGAPLELVEQQLPENQPLPFSLRVPDATMTATLNTAVYAVKEAPAEGAPIATPQRLVFEYSDTSGLRALKEFSFEPSSYIVTFRSDVAAGASELNPIVEWGPGLSDVQPAKGSFNVKPGGLLSESGKEQRLPANSMADTPIHESTYKFAGIDDHYFMSVALDPGLVKVTFHPVALPAPQGTGFPARDLVSYALEPAAQGRSLKFYVGPKDFDQLALVDRELVRAINFGMFSFIVVPLLRSLKWINGFVGNYGWSIIILTVIINLLILPLRHKSVVSMRKMQEIQPEAKAIQERYAKLKATDPARQKMNQELMALYRERGVNPASGCVPMLIPFPILIAFYSLLSTAIELRGQPFLFWIHDLSAPDPLYVTPILMGASQLWQQWIAPAAGMDPAQRKMMLVMPVIFTYLFLGYPAGVALYWFATNLWGIGQQYFTNYLIGPPNIRTVRPAAERKVKRAGPGKTEAAAQEE
jgi:YidC/Oxa1 family membrane protein insertase